MRGVVAKRKPVPLTEAEWRRVFDLRCKSKRGEYLSPEDRALTTRAWNEDEKRYGDMEADVFNATVPFGSTVRVERGPDGSLRRVGGPRARKRG